MKRFIIIAIILLSVVIGSTAVLNQINPNPYFQGKEVEISELNDLPRHIYTSFNQSKYNNWDVFKVYKIFGETGEYEYYELKIRKAGENKDLIFDKSGKLTVVHW